MDFDRYIDDKIEEVFARYRTTKYDEVEQLRNSISTLREQLLDYICKNPDEQPNPQWTEERLRALELQVKELKVPPVFSERYDCVNVRVEKLEQLWRDGRQVHQADYEYCKKAYEMLHMMFKEFEEKLRLFEDKLQRVESNV